MFSAINFKFSKCAIAGSLPSSSVSRFRSISCIPVFVFGFSPSFFCFLDSSFFALFLCNFFNSFRVFLYSTCLLYTSDAADDRQCVDLGGGRIIKKKFFSSRRRHTRCREVSWARRCVYETDTMDRTIKKIIIHCSATREGQDRSLIHI